MPKVVVFCDKAPKPVGPYSHAATAGGWVYLSGQTPVDPLTGKLVSGTTEQMTERVLENLKAALVKAGGTLNDVVKVTVYITDMSNFAKVNAVYGKYFDRTPPARACVQVAALPGGAQIEMDMVAYVGG